MEREPSDAELDALEAEENAAISLHDAIAQLFVAVNSLAELPDELADAFLSSHEFELSSHGRVFELNSDELRGYVVDIMLISRILGKRWDALCARIVDMASRGDA